MTRVTLVQRRLTHYRVPLFTSLRTVLADRGIELVLCCGTGTTLENSKNDQGHLDWSLPVPTTYFAGGRICFQSLGRLVRNTDMLVVGAENKLLNNLTYQFGHPKMRIGLWGHGANLQGDQDSWRERFKSKIACRADWWFGYTEMSRPLILRNGFPEARITILNNSIDTSEMNAQFEGLPPEHRLIWRESRGLDEGPVGVFLGSMYTEKRLDFLLDAALLIHHEIPSFQLVLIGAGPQHDMVQHFCERHSWAHYLGSLNGIEKIRALASCDLMLNPGLVGLGVLDSLVCGVPLVTTDCGLHSPEIAYLENRKNGLMTENDLHAYVQAVIALIMDHSERERFASACHDSAKHYSLSNMVANFSDGIQACLAAPIWRGRH